MSAVRDERIKLLRFVSPQPGRTIGLVWRQTSPRKADFIARLRQLDPHGASFAKPGPCRSHLHFSRQRGFVFQAVVAGEPLHDRAAHPLLQDAADVLARDAGHRREIALRHLLPDEDATAADVLTECVRETEQRARDAALAASGSWSPPAPVGLAQRCDQHRHHDDW